MKIDLLLNDLEKRLTIFKTEEDVKTWLNKNNLTPNITNYKQILSVGNDFIKKSAEEIIKDIELDLLLNKIDVKTNSKYGENFGVEEIAMSGVMGLGIAAGLCVMFPIAIVPTLIIGSIIGLLGGNVSLQKKVCDALIDSSKNVAKSISEQISPSIKELIPENPTYDDSFVEEKVILDCDEIFNSIVSEESTVLPKLSKEQLELKAFLEKRKIKYLVHFTNIKNVESIKKHGILSVQELTQRKIPFSNNDVNRYDRMLDYISLSVTRPNKYVLESFKENGTLKDVNLIYIDASILYEEISVPRIYCDRNAASSSCQKGSTLSDFENMFLNNKAYDRYECYRDNNEPTDTQAEILFNKKVDVKYIKRIVKL